MRDLKQSLVDAVPSRVVALARAGRLGDTAGQDSSKPASQTNCSAISRGCRAIWRDRNYPFYRDHSGLPTDSQSVVWRRPIQSVHIPACLDEVISSLSGHDAGEARTGLAGLLSFLTHGDETQILRAFDTVGFAALRRHFARPLVLTADWNGLLAGLAVVCALVEQTSAVRAGLLACLPRLLRPMQRQFSVYRTRRFVPSRAAYETELCASTDRRQSDEAGVRLFRDYNWPRRQTQSRRPLQKMTGHRLTRHCQDDEITSLEQWLQHVESVIVTKSGADSREHRRYLTLLRRHVPSYSRLFFTRPPAGPALSACPDGVATVLKPVASPVVRSWKGEMWCRQEDDSSIRSSVVSVQLHPESPRRKESSPDDAVDVAS
ncbi:unnamed protein product, partial [Protopolystoma xenopodis]